MANKEESIPLETFKSSIGSEDQPLDEPRQDDELIPLQDVRGSSGNAPQQSIMSSLLRPFRNLRRTCCNAQDVETVERGNGQPMEPHQPQPQSSVAGANEPQPLLEEQLADQKTKALKRIERNKLEADIIKMFREKLKTPSETSAWEELLNGEKLKQLKKLVDEMKLWEMKLKTIPEPKTFLHDAHLQPVLVEMLQDIDKYRTCLQLFIDRFHAENECIVQYDYLEKHKSDLSTSNIELPLVRKRLFSRLCECVVEDSSTVSPANEKQVKSDTKKSKTKKSNAMKPTTAHQKKEAKSQPTKLRAPIHYAVDQLDKEFLEWLLKIERNEERTIDVNLRNNLKQTALALLCEKYDQCMTGMKKAKNEHEKKIKEINELYKQRKNVEKRGNLRMKKGENETNMEFKKLFENLRKKKKEVSEKHEKNLKEINAQFEHRMKGKKKENETNVQTVNEQLENLRKKEIKEAEENHEKELKEIDIQFAELFLNETRKAEKEHETKLYKFNEQLEKIRPIIWRLLDAGADFNICTNTTVMLPFELLLKHCETHDKTRVFLAKCEEKFKYAIAIANAGSKDDKTRSIGFYNNNANVLNTVELSEIFLRYNNYEQFESCMEKIKITNDNVQKVIRLLLHTACEQKLHKYVLLIMKLDKKSAEQGENSTIEQDKESQKKRKTLIFQVEYIIKKTEGRTDEQTYSELKHRGELKGLLKKACLMADLPILKLLLNCMSSDPIIPNDDPVLIVTLAKAYTKNRQDEYQKKLLACAEFLATQEAIHITKRDNSGNTALHLALKYGFDSVAVALLRQKFSSLSMRNKANLTPLDYGTHRFWETYFNNCIEVDKQRSITDRNEIRFNWQGFLAVEGVMAQNTGKAQKQPEASSMWRTVKKCWEIMTDPEKRKDRKFMHTVTEMTTLRQIAESKELERLLLHPVIHTFIMLKGTWLCHLNYLNLLVTALTMFCFGFYSQSACSANGPSLVWRLLSILGVVFVVFREILQFLFLRRSYLSFENLFEFITTMGMICALCIGCNRLLSSFVIIGLGMQVIFLLGSLQWENISTRVYMFKTVSENFLKSFLLFLPLIGAFIYAFHLTYNGKLADHSLADNKDNSSESNFNSFRTFWNATIKTLVMTTGEFEAATIDFSGGKMLLFIVFLFLAPIVILNLINGLAVSDIAAIQKESELYSMRKTVVLLERYERGAANVHPLLKRFFPKPFFEKYEYRIHIKTKDDRKIEVHVREVKKKQESKDTPGPGAGSSCAQGQENTSQRPITSTADPGAGTSYLQGQKNTSQHPIAYTFTADPGAGPSNLQGQKNTSQHPTSSTTTPDPGAESSIAQIQKDPSSYSIPSHSATDSKQNKSKKETQLLQKFFWAGKHRLLELFCQVNQTTVEKALAIIEQNSKKDDIFRVNYGEDVSKRFETLLFEVAKVKELIEILGEKNNSEHIGRRRTV